MNCKVSREQLWSWIDREAPELEVHLAACPRCRAMAEEFRVDIDGIATDSSEIPLPLPERIGPYRVVRLIGEGGQALVYEAEQESPRRRVAIKVLKGGPHVGTRSVRRFRREMQALANLRHPSIATIHEAGRTEEGQYYFVMQLVAGTPLHAHLASAKPDRRRRLQIFHDICEGVAHAHQHGVVHRDLKPSNIMIDEKGVPVILDFGLARIADPDISLATTVDARVVEGTPRYMSPEQVRGRTEEIDARTDVYSLGVILYELLLERPPFEIHDLSPDAVQLICEGSPRRPGSIDPTLRGDLDTIILRALEKDPSLRYPSVEALDQDVVRNLEGKPILSRKASLLRSGFRSAVRHRRWLAAALGASLLLIAWGAWQIVRAPIELEAARRRALETDLRLLGGGEVDDELIAAAEEAAARHPDLPEAILVAAHANFAGREMRFATETLEAAIRREPDQAAYRLLLAEIQGRVTARPLGEEPGDPLTAEDWYLRCFATLDARKALELAERAVACDSSHTLALRAVVSLGRMRGDLEASLRATRRLLVLENRPIGWLETRGEILTLMGRDREALAVFNELIRRGPSDRFYYHRRAMIHRQLGEYEDAVADFTRSIEHTRRPSYRAWTHYHRALAFWMLGRRADAAADYRRAYELLRYTTYGNARLYLILREDGLDGEAEAALDEARRAVWDDPWMVKILDCLGGRITPEALVAAADPARPKTLCEGLYYAGEAYLLSGRTAQALEMFERCRATGIRLDPDTPLEPMSEYELAGWRLAAARHREQASFPR